jgi:trans-aconitate 2-methyltransferase
MGQVNAPPQRLMIGRDLLRLLPVWKATTIYDVGCGTGQLTRELANKYGACHGIDIDPIVIDVARRLADRDAAVQFATADLRNWSPKKHSVDVLFCHFVLHWLQDHETILRRFADCLRFGGVLAIAIPVTARTGLRRALNAVCDQRPWSEHVADVRLPASVHSVSWYSKVLKAIGLEPMICETRTYHFRLTPHELIAWINTSVLPLYLNRLCQRDWRSFVQSMDAALRMEYRVDHHGKIGFALPVRRFMARKHTDAGAVSPYRIPHTQMEVTSK